MGSVRGRAVLDFVRHQIGWTARGAFDTKEFWERSYARAVTSHEWALDGSKLLEYDFAEATPRRSRGGRARAELKADAPPDKRTLVLGAGTSALGRVLKDAGWRDVAAVDFSEVAVARGQKVEPDVDWRLGDARRLDETFAPGEFGSVVVPRPRGGGRVFESRGGAAGSRGRGVARSRGRGVAG